MEKEKIFIIGARRGLGREILNQWRTTFCNDHLVATSRREFVAEGVETCVFDLSLSEHVELLVQKLQTSSPTRLFYIAGGGPYGSFAEKAWKDHLWALQVSLLSPLRVLHACLGLSSLKQVVLVGSAIAENQPDPGAASYAAAKHGLLGCVSSLQTEVSKDVRLFSPGYMNTDMLPVQAQHRLQSKAPVDSPALVAKLFIDWVQNPQASWHWEGRPRS